MEVYGRGVRLAIFALLGMSACGSTERAAQPNEPPRETAEPVESPAPERITFSAEDGLTLVGFLRRGPQGAPALILVHQLSSNHLEWEPIIASMPEGLTILSVDMRGHGQSIDRDGQTVGWRAFAGPDWEPIVDDVHRAIDWLKRELGAERFVLGGASIGSSAVLLAAVDRPEVVGVFALSPGRAYRGLDTIRPAPGLSDRNLLFVAAGGEAPAKEAAEELARLSEGHVQIVGGNAHGVRMVGAAPDLPARLATFVSTSLEPRTEESP